MPDGSPPEHRTAASLVNLANIVTFFRLCAVPLAFWLVLDHRIDLAFWLFAAAGLSDELVALCKTSLAPYKYPRWIEFVPELPKTATGKIQRFKLRA